jgi:hypothetical protein
MHIFEINTKEDLLKVTNVMSALSPQFNEGNIETILVE